MKVERFEDLESWQEARLLVSDTYRSLAACRDLGFRAQMQRAAVSVMSNIAEGFDRGSNKELVQYLIISRGSVSEVKSLAYAGLDIGHVDEKTFERIRNRCVTVTNLLNGFIRYLRNSSRNG